jgi:hypothetical protein
VPPDAVTVTVELAPLQSKVVAEDAATNKAGCVKV